jgi:hypothetical protein
MPHTITLNPAPTEPFSVGLDFRASPYPTASGEAALEDYEIRPPGYSDYIPVSQFSGSVEVAPGQTSFTVSVRGVDDEGADHDVYGDAPVEEILCTVQATSAGGEVKAIIVCGAWGDCRRRTNIRILRIRNHGDAPGRDRPSAGRSCQEHNRSRHARELLQ